MEEQLQSIAVPKNSADILSSILKEGKLMSGLSSHHSIATVVTSRLCFPQTAFLTYKWNFKDYTKRCWELRKSFLFLKIVEQKDDSIWHFRSRKRGTFVQWFQLIIKKMWNRKWECQSFSKLCNHSVHCKIKIYPVFCT